MIIDSHAHIGPHENIFMDIEDIFYSMEKYKIDFTLICDTNGEEYKGDMSKLDLLDQVSAAKRFLKVVKKNKNKIGALLWMKPNHETVTKKLKELIKDNREYIYGLKFHPYHSNLSFNDIKMREYFKLAEEFNLPIVSHTATDSFSDPKAVFGVAKQYPNIDFILVHMGLGSDNTEAIDLISSLPNLYGDTTWVPVENTIKAIKKCGPHKIVFGTDNPIAGKDTLGKEFYKGYFETLKESLSDKEYTNLMFGNAKKIFNIKVI